MVKPVKFDFKTVTFHPEISTAEKEIKKKVGAAVAVVVLMLLVIVVVVGVVSIY